jgi:hypothetical protein
MNRLTGEVVILSPNNMALIYEKVPLYKAVKAWDNNNPTCLESTNFRAMIRKTKVMLKSTRIMETMVSNSLLTKRSLSSTRELKNVTLTGQTPLWSSRMCSRAITKQLGNRCFMSTSQSLLMRWCQYWPHKVVAWKKTSIKQSSSLFSKR